LLIMAVKRVVECVPNFSEGRRPEVVQQIADAIASVEDVRVLHIDRGEAANRTVITFIGESGSVVEAAFRGVQKAGELIDMRQQHGEHPRIGATDVLPLIPIEGITLDECAQLARQLALRIADEARIPCYLYEASALRPERKNLAVCRAGEYEQLPQKLATPDLAPDYGTRPYDEGIARTGCTVVGARELLLAVNFNLNTTSAQLANDIARRVRAKGHNGIRGTLPSTKALGWYIEEYGIAQVSMNLCSLSTTPLHIAYEEVCRQAAAIGLQVTGTEIIGLVPESTLLAAARYFLAKQGKPADGQDKDELVSMAVKAMHLDDLFPFDLNKKVLKV